MYLFLTDMDAKKLRPKALKLAQLLARLKAADDNGYCVCVSCGTIKHYKLIAGGHFIPKGASSYHALRYESCNDYGCNIHAQCHGCNNFGMKHGTASQKYTIFMQNTYGHEKVERMLAHQKKPIKMYKADYLEMIADLNAKIKKEQKRIA